MPEEEKGFEVKDRRKAKEALDSAGEAAHTEEQAAQPQEGAAESGPGGESPGEDRRSPGGEERALPPVDFMSFIGSLAATAFMYMGERMSPDQPESFKDLGAAKQMIDLLDLIKAKTRGNLDKEESDGLDSILYNLRMRYINESKR